MPQTATRRWRLTAAVAIAVTVPIGLAVGPAVVASASPAGQLVVTSVSNPRPGLVSGGDVLLRVTAPSGATPGSIAVDAGGRSVRDRFVRQDDGSLLGLVTGLGEGTTTVTATYGAAGSVRPGRLVVTNHPRSGPVFSGPQQTPFACQTTAFGLAPALPSTCSAPTQVSYVYFSTDSRFAPLASRSDRPADLASARVGDRVVPYVVRVERGTIDRAVYEVAALDDGVDPTPTRQDTSWNGALVYTFGGGCNAGYHQGTATGGVLDDLFLRQGYAVASSTLNVLDTSCSTVISAEAAMMVKEHVAETYGPPRHTIGWGGSGGAIQQYAIADAYPGILDGIVPGISFPDALTVLPVVVDCSLLHRYFASGGVAATFTPAQRDAVSGFTSFSSCDAWTETFADRVTATGSCDPSVPAAARYDAATNPHGVRCDLFEQLVNQLGRDPGTRFARSTVDNHGVQYGLGALAAGTITAAQFVDLNARVGGLDQDGAPVRRRSVADAAALAAAYRTDLVDSASLGLRTTPVIDQRTDLDLAPGDADIHTTEWSFVMRERMLRANGTAANQVILQTGYDDASQTAAAAYELDAMERWLSALDRSSDRSSQGVAAARPDDLGDGCYLSPTRRILAVVTDPAGGPCGDRFPVATNPRLASGQPLALTALSCRLRPLDPSSYPVQLTSAQLTRLRSAFPDGVCDRSRPGVGEQAPLRTWRTYGDTP